ncbi:beta-ketoacyl synthase N-terminal-like domain-containing protein [Streptomyces sp. NPDC097619]|uniref:type I polyketide synthase n=1 Tax=Streptomyces sp. NPDC097619 TaxID=3157228 RepID=UPI00333080DD
MTAGAEPVAVVGIDCLFPGAAGTAAYWELLMRGGDATGTLPQGRWPGDGAEEFGRGGYLEGADAFDHGFFTVTPREAAAMDPQQRLLLQCAWRALEDSGRAPGSLAGSDTGVFVGTMSSEWAQLHLGDPGRATPQLAAGSSGGMTANRISYHLNLKGPSLAVDTACSSSLVAVHLAVNSLLSGECGTALACGANLVQSPALGRVYRQMGLAAPDGRCKPFSADADGIGRADGIGVVVLRRLADALADRQPVYAVIRGTAVNQDGRSNGMTAPSRWSQQEVVAAAYRRAGVTADRVRFVEAHGTGTVLGDTIECAALGEVHGVPRAEPCAIGSVKGNLGHAEGAAGIAGLIKVALALHHRTVPASRFAARENPQLRLAERGLRLLGAPLRLPAGESFGAVSSFGMGGTNAHVVLSSAPRRTRGRMRAAVGGAAGGALAARVPARADAAAADGGGVFTVSADTPEALRRNLLAQAEAVGRRPLGDAAALCLASNRVKTGLPYRAAFPVRDTGELAAALRAAAADERLAAGIADRAPRSPTVAFLYTGQGSQHPGMTAALYRSSPLYRRFLDEADAALRPHTGASVREAMLGAGPGIHRTAVAQPALFAVGYALTRTLGELGVVPDAVLGHSVGEFAAAVAAGALPLAEAARLVAARALLMDAAPGSGGMLAVRAGRDRVAELLGTLLDGSSDDSGTGSPVGSVTGSLGGPSGGPLDGALAGLLAGGGAAGASGPLTVAAYNGPSDLVLSGPSAALHRAAERLRAAGVAVRPLEVSHAFHSPAMAPAAAGLAEAAAGTVPAPPRIPFASTRYGRILAHEPLDAGYWAGQLTGPVWYARALDALVTELAPACLVEIGPAPVLLRLAPRGATLPAGTRLLHPAPGPGATGREPADTVAGLYLAGLEPRWEGLYGPGPHLPERPTPYVFSTEHRFPARPLPLTARPAAPAPDRGAADPTTTTDIASTAAATSTADATEPTAIGGVVDGTDPVRGEGGGVFLAVREAVVEVGGYEAARVRAGARFYEDLGFDSVMLMQLKDRIGTRLPQAAGVTVQELLPAMSTVGALAAFLAEWTGTAVAA